MEKTIRKRTYDTDRSVLVGSYVVSFYGDPAGYEERLYQTEDGLFFLYGAGGEASPYPQETIRAVSRANAEKWREAHAH